MYTIVQPNFDPTGPVFRLVYFAQWWLMANYSTKWAHCRITWTNFEHIRNCWILHNYSHHNDGEAVLILVLFRVLFLVSNEAKECSTPNSTPLVGVLFVVLHSNGLLFVVFSFKSFGVLKTVPFGERQLFKLALCLALDTSLICRSLVLNGVLKAVPNGVLKGVLFAVLHSKRSVVCRV